MLPVVVVIAVVWAVLLGAAYLARVRLGLGRLPGAAAVAAAYLALCGLALAWFGVTQQGLLASAGMACPLLAALGVALFAPVPRR